MKNLQLTVWILLGSSSVIGCSSSSEETMTTKPVASVVANAVDPKTRKAIRQNEKLLGPDERRLSVFVVPGDAVVEVDGQRVERRDGVVELVGKVGDVFLLRAWKGEKSSDTKEITIGEAGANPAIVDVFEVKPLAKNLKSKPKAARFDLDE